MNLIAIRYSVVRVYRLERRMVFVIAMHFDRTFVLFIRRTLRFQKSPFIVFKRRCPNNKNRYPSWFSVTYLFSASFYSGLLVYTQYLHTSIPPHTSTRSSFREKFVSQPPVASSVPVTSLVAHFSKGFLMFLLENCVRYALTRWAVVAGRYMIVIYNDGWKDSRGTYRVSVYIATY